MFRFLLEWFGTFFRPQPPLPQPPPLPPSSPATEQKLSNRQRQVDNMAHARACKQEIKTQEGLQANLEALFWAGAPAETDMDSKEEIYVMAMRKIDSNWNFADITAISGACYRTLKERRVEGSLVFIRRPAGHLRSAVGRSSRSSGAARRRRGACGVATTAR
jgi:hypothetical protein